MTSEEVIHIYENSRLTADCFTADGVAAAYVAGLAALRAQAEAETNEPLTQEQISGMHFEKIWLDYGKDDDGEDNGGEWAVVLFGKIYSIGTLEGAGFEDMLFDLMDGETLDHPSGQYTVRRHKPKEVPDHA